jgi:hypothetical protein
MEGLLEIRKAEFGKRPSFAPNPLRGGASEGLWRVDAGLRPYRRFKIL